MKAQRADGHTRGISIERLSALYPRLDHVSEVGSWEGIRRHGLLSTSALLDRFDVSPAQRAQIESSHRPHSVTLRHKDHGECVIRDQKPMDDRRLERALRNAFTPSRWYSLLNRHVFFWLSHERVQRLLGARAYRSRQQTLLVVDTAALLRVHSDRTVLSPLNTGATKPMPHERGADCFLPLSDYPFELWFSKRRGKDPIVELAIQYAVPDVTNFVERVALVQAGQPDHEIWHR